MSKKTETVDGDVVEKKGTEEGNGTSIVVADKMLPPLLPLVPLYDRPLFPRMMTPIVVMDSGTIKKVLKTANLSSGYIGLALMKQKKEHSPEQESEID